jgi:hypothetical protein
MIKDPEYKKRFKERLKDLHMQQQPQQQQQNGIKKPLINGTTSTTAVNGSSLMRTAVSKSCDNHINETTPRSPAGQNGNSNGNGNSSSPNNQANEMLSNSLNTLLNGGGDDFDDESSDYMNGGSNAHIYDNNGILTPDENGNICLLLLYQCQLIKSKIYYVLFLLYKFFFLLIKNYLRLD